MGLFFISVICILWAMAATVMAWLVCAFPALPRRALLLVLPILLTAFIIGGIAYSRSHYHAGTGVLYYAAYILFGFLFIAFCAAAVSLFLYWVLGILHAPRVWLGPTNTLFILAACGLAVWGGFSEPKLKIIRVNSPQMPKLKIALLSDSHLGRGVSLARFDKALSRLQAQQPDVLLVLGDVFEYGQNREKYAERIKNFSAPLGKYGVLGNHEYYSGYENSVQFYKEAGITLLQNELTQLPNGVQVAGLKDIKTARVTPQEIGQLLQQADPQRPLILLSHTPLYAEEAAEAGADLMFSGHTHNGQIWPFEYLVKLQFPRVYGLFDIDGLKFYITSGMFYWGIPLRFLTSAELPVIEVN